MADDENPSPVESELHQFMVSLSSLEAAIKDVTDQPPRRHWDKATTRMGDIPDDLTVEESQELFGTPYDESSMRLKHLLETFGPEGRFDALLQHVQHVTDPVFRIEPDETVEEARPKGILIDLVTVGLLAHDILSNIDIDNMGVIRASDLLNGKGPFGE